MATPSSSASITRVRMSSSFQQARLAEQLRLSNKQQAQSEDDVATDDKMTSQAESTTLAETAVAVAASSIDDNTSTSSSSLQAPEEAAQDLLASESDLLGSDGMPMAPMMTYQKYLTMQEKRVKVTIRYSAEAGLRPFYLTVVNRIKSKHPDALLEKRILPKLGSDASEDEAIFEVVVDGKTVIGKKSKKMLKVSTLAARKGDDDDSKESDAKNNKGTKAKFGSGEPNKPNLAGGRSVFVSMEKLDQELDKARKRRRPSSMYKSKEALRGELAATTATGADQQAGMEGGQQESGNTELSSEIADAVMRLEKLKAMSTASGRI